MELKEGHDVCVCFFRGNSRQRIRRHTECVTACIHKQQLEEDSVCILISGKAISMFGLAWKLNSTLYWMTRRMRVQCLAPVTEDITAAAPPSVNFLMDLNLKSNFCIRMTFRTWCISSFNPVPTLQNFHLT